MAFTVSHAVLAPLLHHFFGRSLPIAAVAIGCMAPDLYRLFTQKHYFEPHQWDSIFSVTLWIGLIFCAVWYGLYRPTLYRLFGLQDPLAITNFKQSCIFFSMTIAAIVLGICTHLIWDGLTHVDFRTFVFHEFLAQSVNLFGHTYPMHRILQIGSSALALPFIIWMSWQYYQRHQQHLAVPQTVKYWGYAMVTLSLLIGLFSVLDYLRHIPTQYFQSGMYHITGRAINEFSQGFLITFSLSCILFLFLDRGRRLG